MSGEFDSRKDSQSTKFEQRPWILVKLSFRELSYSKLSGLHTNAIYPAITSTRLLHWQKIAVKLFYIFLTSELKSLHIHTRWIVIEAN